MRCETNHIIYPLNILFFLSERMFKLSSFIYECNACSQVSLQIIDILASDGFKKKGPVNKRYKGPIFNTC